MAEPRPPLPFVIDNRRHRLADVLQAVLAEHVGNSLDVATAYFSISGYRHLRRDMPKLGSFRLLLGTAPEDGVAVGMRPRSPELRGLLRQELEREPFTEETLRLVEDLIAFLRQERVAVRVADNGFLHAKAWIFYGDHPLPGGPYDRFEPRLAIVGSSNFTGPGLTSNREMNLVHKVLLDPAEVDDAGAAEAVAWLRRGRVGQPLAPAAERQLTKSEIGARAVLDLETWFEEQWQESRDFKDELVEILAASKLGTREYSPYQVYLKALFEYFRDDLEDGELPAANRSAVELAEFQEDAVRKARRILDRHHGVLVADSVGLGKTWIGKKLLEDFAYHQRMKALVVCPASLRENWQRELASASIAGQVLSQEELGRDSFDLGPWRDVDVVLVDESHNFRNPATRRYASLERLLAANGKRGKAGERKKVILLTATPINNDLFDLYHQISLITLGDRGHFLGSGIGDLYSYFVRARRDANLGGGTALYNLLEEIVIRRTRPYIRRAYPEATIQGKAIHFPERRLRSVRYDLEATYGGIYETIVSGVESLKLAPYNLESYKKPGEARDDLELGREQALVGIFKSRYLKRFESSIEAFRISVRRALEFLETFESYILDGRLLASSDFHRAVRYLEREDQDESVPSSLADELDANEEAQRFLASLPEIADPRAYDLRKLHQDLRHDAEVLRHIWQSVKPISPAQDAKLAMLQDLLRGELAGKKVLLFTYYRDTARYLYRQLGHPESAAAQAFRAELGGPNIRRMDSGADARERLQLVQAFAPVANGRPDWAGTEREIRILISTDVLSEGQNLQDCGYLLNYDLHWNPTRLVQRAGRIDRIGTGFDTLWLYNMFPDEGLERLLRLVESLTAKLAAIDAAGFHDASILGEGANPRNFNSLRRLEVEDAAVLLEEEERSELPTSDGLAQLLRGVLESQGRAAIEGLPDGIHSGLERSGARGAFFYLQAETPEGKQHFWRYVDLREDSILDNRQLIAGLIEARPETPRVVDGAIWARIFDLQERVIADVLRSVENRAALEVAPARLDPAQQGATTVLQGALHHPQLARPRVLALLRFLSEPMVRADVKELKGALGRYQRQRDPVGLVESLEALQSRNAGTPTDTPAPPSRPAITREQLRLICFDLISGG